LIRLYILWLKYRVSVLPPFLQRWGAVLIATAFTGSLIITAIPPKPQRSAATHGGTHMYLLWDRSAAALDPNWEFVTTYDGKFIRGDSIANFGCPAAQSPCGNSTHQPTISSTSRSLGTTNVQTGIIDTNVASSTHTHNISGAPTVNSAAVDNSPAYREYRLIRYKGDLTSGIPATIPKWAVAMFDETGLPAVGWTRISAGDDRFIKIGTNGVTGGSNTHTHTVNWSGVSLGASSGTAVRQSIGADVTNATAGHTHAIGNVDTTTSDTCSTAGTTCLPKHVSTVLAEADNDTINIPPGLIAFFDGAPGTGWANRSESGDIYNDQFFKGATVFNGTSLGSSTHDHSGATKVSNGPGAGQTSANLSVAGDVAGGTHTHTLTPDFSVTNHVPPYTNFVVAEKINFEMVDFRWYVDSGNLDVTDPWSAADIPQNTNILIVPPIYEPLTTSGIKLRLRVRLLVGGGTLLPGGLSIKMQWKEGINGSCITTTTGSWNEMSTSSTWAYSDTGPGATTSSSLTGQTSRLSPASTVMQLYQRAHGTTITNPNTANVDETIEYDFHIRNMTFTSNKGYTFRLVENNGTLMNDYEVCPGVETLQTTSDQLRHGTVFTSGFKRGFTWSD
jgi:hypothetical protein